MNTSKRVLSGAAWAYGVQVVTVVIQFAYAAITSRTVSPEGFGSYAVAMSVTALISLVANGGLAQTVARILVVDKEVIRGLASYSLLLGGLGAALLWLTADAWALLWNAPSSAEPIRWLTLSTLIAPYLGLASGVMRRQGKFRVLATVTLSANVLGMAGGAVAVLLWQSPSSLLVSPILSQALILVGCFFMSDRLLFGFERIAKARNELAFSLKVLLTTILYYFSGNVGKWSASVGLGAAAIGSWNRADVVSTVPFQQIQSALLQAIYPEFRHDRVNSDRAKRIWPDLLGLVAWLAVPASCIAAVVLPSFIPLLFGAGWEEAAALTAPLALAGGLQVVSSLLANALEAVGRFKWIYSAQITMVAVNVTGAAVAISLESWIPIISALLLAIVMQHCVHVVLSARAGYLDFAVLVRHYLAIALTSAIATLVAWGILRYAASGLSNGWVWLICAVLMILAGCAAWKFRFLLPPLRLAKKFGILVKD